MEQSRSSSDFFEASDSRSLDTTVYPDGLYVTGVQLLVF
jgi:hypothetical protein